MPQPTARDVHIDAAMTNLSLGYRNEGYISEKVFPSVGVAKASDYYFVFNKGAWFRDEAGQRAPSTRAPRGGYPLSKDRFSCQEWAFAKEVSDEERENADAPLMPDQAATEFCTEKVLIRRERLVAAAVCTAANWAAGQAEDAEGLWAAGVGNTFIADVERALEVVRKATGRRPNVMVMDAGTLAQLKQESTLLARIQITQKAVVTADLIASLFDLEECLIGGAIYSSGEEKADGSDWTSAGIWETNATKGSAALIYRPKTPAIMTPSAGYVFQWKPRVVKRWREEAEHQDVLEASESLDVKITGSDLGFLFYDAILT